MASSPRKPRKKKSPLAKAKEDCWKAFSIYIRTRDCIRFRNKLDEGMCVTCKRIYPFKELQAGHFIQGRKNSVLLDERIVYTQCYSCNGNPPFGLGGNYVEYYVFMLHEWGQEMIDEFRALKHQTKIYKTFDYIRMEQEFKDKTTALINAYNA